jgi:putative FmdB family regulatory protein
MPVYEYRCRSCEERFSKTESIAEHSASSGSAACPRCRSTDVERVISASYPRTARKS